MSARPELLTGELLARVLDVLEAESTLTLSVTGEDGLPHAAPVFYVTGTGEGAGRLDLYWLSSTKSQHSAALAADPRVAVAIYKPTFAWREILGVQMRGLCSVVEGEEREALLSRYVQRFQLGTLFSMAIRQSTLYRFRPIWGRLTDNSQVFASKAEFILDEEGSGRG